MVELAVAFNDMQRRIERLIEDRTQALAAVSHDLKTPITRLRFRAEDLADGVARDAMAEDLTEMERMLDQTLSFLRGDRSDEELKPIDIVAILGTLVDDAADRGASIELSGAAHAIVTGRRLALKRAFSNLIDNALKYGERARVQVDDRQSDVLVKSVTTAPASRLGTSSGPFHHSSGLSHPGTLKQAVLGSDSRLPRRSLTGIPARFAWRTVKRELWSSVSFSRRTRRNHPETFCNNRDIDGKRGAATPEQINFCSGLRWSTDSPLFSLESAFL